VRVLPGEAVVARSGAGVLVIEPVDQSAWPAVGALFRTLQDARADGEAFGEELVRGLRELVGSKPGAFPAFAAIAPGANGLVTLLMPGTELVYADGSGTARRAGRESAEGIDCTIPADAAEVVVGIEPVAERIPAGFGQLVSGVVPGAGVVLRLDPIHTGAEDDTGETRIEHTEATPPAASDERPPGRTTLTESRRERIGVLVFDDGSVYDVDHDFVIGREPQADEKVVAGLALGIALQDEEQAVSRVHVELALEGDRLELTDRGSTNGTFLLLTPTGDWSQVPANEPVPLPPGAQVVLGRRTFVFESP
jgi:hypothetical protein